MFIQFSRPYLAISLFMTALSACSGPSVKIDPSGGGIPKSFNEAALSGTMSFSEDGEISLEDYILSSRSGGSVTFNTCSDVIDHPEGATIPSEYYFYKKYSVDCYAAQKYLAGRASTDSFVAIPLTQLMPDFPAAISPQIGEKGVYDIRLDKKLMEFFPNINLDDKSDISVSTAFDGLEVDYDIVGRADLNADGHEDILLMMRYSSIEGSGRGSQLVALSKTSKAGSIDVLWDYN